MFVYLFMGIMLILCFILIWINMPFMFETKLVLIILNQML